MAASKDTKQPGFWDSVFQIFAGIVTSARHEVVERGWFGRQVTDTGGSIHDQTPTMQVQPPAAPDCDKPTWEMKQQSFDEAWAVRGRDLSRDAEQPGHDIDR